MDSTIIAAVITALVGILATVLGLFLGTYLTKRASIETAKELATLEHRKLVRSRLWDHQRDAYSEIILKLRTLWSAASALGEAHQRGDTGDGYEKAVQSFWIVWSKNLDHFHAGNLVFSEEFQDRHQELIDVVAKGMDDYPDDDNNYYEWLSGHLGKAVGALKEIGRRDIGADVKPV